MKNLEPLREAFADLRSVPFPEGSDLDQVADIHARLVEYDGFVAGIVHSLLQERHVAVPTFDSSLVQDLEAALRNCPEGAPQLAQYRTRLTKLRSLLELAAQVADPAERSAHMRLFYRDWRPTLLGRWLNRFWGLWSALGLPPRIMATLEVRGRASGRTRANPIVIATVDGKQYLVSMLGPKSEWVKNIEAAHGAAVIHQRRRRRVHLVPIPPEERAPVLREYVRIATSGRTHFPVAKNAPLPEFQAIAPRYPVFRIDPA